MDTASEQEESLPIKPHSGKLEVRSLQILVVDDEVDNAETLAMLLRLHSYSVRVAFDGLQALREVEAAQPDVILLDIGLPKMDGFQVAQRVRAMKAHKPPLVIAVTGHGQEEHVRRAQEAGFDLHLLKPIRFDELQAVFRRLEGIVS